MCIWLEWMAHANKYDNNVIIEEKQMEKGSGIPLK